MSPSLPQLVMRRPHLRRLPKPDLAPGYAIRSFQSGDEAAWNHLMAAAFERELTQFDFRRMTAKDPAFRPERVRLVTTEKGALAATASSWVVKRFGPDNAMLHWVGTHPDHGGRRLGYEISLDALNHARGERRAAAMLLTDDERTAAIKTYLRLGFVPVLAHDSHADRWRDILRRLGTHQHHLALLEGPLEQLS